MGRPVLSLLNATLPSERGVGDWLLLAVMAEVVGVVVSAFLFTPFFWETEQTAHTASGEAVSRHTKKARNSRPDFYHYFIKS